MTDQRVRLYLGGDHACGYLPERRACSLFIDPRLPMDAARYGALLDMGFRRSGDYVYRPHCPRCSACTPARLLASEFEPDRSQRRCVALNAGLQCQIGDRLTAAHYDLYRRYLRSRHPTGGMDPEDESAFRSFLGCRWLHTQVWSFSEGGTLLAAAIVDIVPRGISAVYTFFEPDLPKRGLGTFAVLQQVAHARAENLPYVYLGYWVGGSQTMDYKRRYRPLEVLRDGRWVPFSDERQPVAAQG